MKKEYPLPLLEKITEPTLILDKNRCLANIQAMVDKARNAGVRLRPHCKTHQSHTVGRWLRKAGIEQITVSSFRMAEYFAADGWRDITVAFPVNILEIDTINRLAAHIQLQVVAESIESLQAMETRLEQKIGIFIKIDTGYHRTGISWENRRDIDRLLSILKQSRHMQFVGFLTHAGHSYKARSLDAISEIHETSLATARRFKEAYINDYPNLILSAGDTPTCSRMNSFPGADEIRPGNFVFYDLTQSVIGSCTIDQIAVAMACPVVAKHASRKEIIVYGGGVHLSKDRLTAPNGNNWFGQLVVWTSKGWRHPGFPSIVSSLSQEHGIIKADSTLFDQIQVGDLLGILPVHSCMAADLMKRYQTTDGEWIEMMPKN